MKLANIFLGLKKDDVDFGPKEAEEGHRGAEADGHAQSGNLNLGKGKSRK